MDRWARQRRQHEVFVVVAHEAESFDHWSQKDDDSDERGWTVIRQEAIRPMC